MDQTQFILDQIQAGGFALSNMQAFGTGLGIIVSTFIMWGFMTKNINEKIRSKADAEATSIRFTGIESDITDIKDTAKEDRLLFLTEMRELRKDLRLKKNN